MLAGNRLLQLKPHQIMEWSPPNLMKHMAPLYIKLIEYCRF
jgi:hypothetical protein